MALRTANLVVARRQGRNQLYQINAEEFSRALIPWLTKYSAYWSNSLDKLRVLAEASDDLDR